MARAEAISPALDDLISECFLGLLNQDDADGKGRLKEAISKWYCEQGTPVSRIEFRFLDPYFDMLFSHQRPPDKLKRPA
jgi:hypothetical protein